MRRLIFPIVLGLAGVAILVSLGNWQMRRLAWKEGILAEIDARMASAPADLPFAELNEEAHEYLPVAITGAFTGERVIVLTSLEGQGPGYRVIEAFETEGGDRILADRGFLPDELRGADLSPAPGNWEGNLSWPDEVDGFTPEPEGDLWFARDLPAMAGELGTIPVLAVLTTQTDPQLTPMPIDTAGIPNDHREYAITWYLLALVWAVMSGYYGWRVLRRKD
jgi:surfeit locus 1 family protein